jgi:hypothetical protein
MTCQLLSTAQLSTAQLGARPSPRPRENLVCKVVMGLPARSAWTRSSLRRLLERCLARIPSTANASARGSRAAAHAQSAALQRHAEHCRGHEMYLGSLLYAREEAPPAPLRLFFPCRVRPCNTRRVGISYGFILIQSSAGHPLCLRYRTTVRGLSEIVCPHLKPFSCWRATMPYLSSAKACAITTGPGTCPHVSTFTGFDHGHQCRCRECASSPTPATAR